MTIVERRITEIGERNVCYAQLDDANRVIYRTIEQHVKAVGKEPTIGDIVKFKRWEDAWDGSSYGFLEPTS